MKNWLLMDYYCVVLSDKIAVHKHGFDIKNAE